MKHSRANAYACAVLLVVGAACGDDDDGRVVTDTDTGGAGTSERVVALNEIVSDETGAEAMDETLVNAWGLAFNPMGVAWVSATETGLSAVYDVEGNQVIPSVTIPAPPGQDDPSAPTGQVHNGDSEAFEGDLFIFVTEDGTIAGWQPSAGEQATTRVDNSEADAVYKGVAIAENAAGDPLLFAADFRNAKIDVFDASYEPADVSGGFSDADIPDGFAPFNVEELDGMLIVAYAMQDDDGDEDVPGLGNGYVDLFDTDGNLLSRLITMDELNSPWGITMTPDGFDPAPNRLLIGNFGDGLIHVYDLDVSDPENATATAEGPLRTSNGDMMAIDGLWALEFGVDAGGFSSDTLYYTAGPDDETHGVFGSIEPDQADADDVGTGTDPGTAGYSEAGY